MKEIIQNICLSLKDRTESFKVYIQNLYEKNMKFDENSKEYENLYENYNMASTELNENKLERNKHYREQEKQLENNINILRKNFKEEMAELWKQEVTDKEKELQKLKNQLEDEKSKINNKKIYANELRNLNLELTKLLSQKIKLITEELIKKVMIHKPTMLNRIRTRKNQVVQTVKGMATRMLTRGTKKASIPLTQNASSPSTQKMSQPTVAAVPVTEQSVAKPPRILSKLRNFGRGLFGRTKKNR
jgi:hypothetical protein